MKVLLVNPCQINLVNKKGLVYNRVWLPLDLANCGAVLEEASINVAILDANAERLGPEEVAKRANGYDKVFITSTSLDRWQCPFLDIKPFLDTVDAVKKVIPEIYVMGTHGTVKPNEILEMTGATAVIRGEPERTVLDICKTANLSDVKGITYFDGKNVQNNIDQEPVDLNELPVPAFYLLPMKKYNYEIMGNNFCLFEMSRGCASNCTFCLSKLYGRGVRKKTVDKLIKDVEFGIHNFGVRKAYFMDLEFTVFRTQVIEFCKYLIEKNYDFQWCCQTRFDLVDDELLRYMRDAGCNLIHFGVEAGSDKVLETINKGVTMDSIRDGMKKVKASNIASACFFMMGFPDAEFKDLDDIVKFAIELEPDYPVFHIVAPYPGTKLYETIKNDPKYCFSDDNLFPEAIIGNIPVIEIRKKIRLAYLRYYLRPSYLLSRIYKLQFTMLKNQIKLFWAFVSTK